MPHQSPQSGCAEAALCMRRAFAFKWRALWMIHCAKWRRDPFKIMNTLKIFAFVNNYTLEQSHRTKIVTTFIKKNRLVFQNIYLSMHNLLCYLGTWSHKFFKKNQTKNEM